MARFSKVKEYIFLGIILEISLIWQGSILSIFSPLHLVNQGLFLTFLIDRPVFLPLWSGYIFSIGSIILIYFFAKYIFKGKAALLPPLILGLSPWLAYLLAVGSIYPFLLFLLLLISYGFIQMKNNQAFSGSIFFVSGIALFCMSSIFGWIMLILFIILSFSFWIKFKKTYLFLAAILFVTIVISLTNLVGLKNIYNQSVALFHDPGLINSTNDFQGQSQKANLRFLSKISENKYEYELRYLILKTTKQIVPATYFSPQEKLLGFSFTAPLYLALIIPFFYGLYLIFKNKKAGCLKWVILFIIPSLLAQQMVDLNRLILLLPALVLIITYGFINLDSLKNHKLIISIIIILLALQLWVTVFDVKYRETTRYYKDHCEFCFEMEKQ